jgi:hypothetical protein
MLSALLHKKPLQLARAAGVQFFVRPLAISLLLACTVAGQHRGGSNYAWFQLDPDCRRGPYGVIANYHTAKSVIDQQLRDMFAKGQRRLRIPIYHGRRIGGGTNLESFGGDLTPQCRENFKNLLATIRQIGFSEIIVGFFPQGYNQPLRWTAFQPDIFAENWRLIRNLRPLIAAAGVPYRIDLANETSPDPAHPIALEYCQRLWNLYAAAYGTRDTVGFSIIVDAGRLQLLPAVYGNSPFGRHGRPNVLDLHFYADPATHFETAASMLRAAGYRQPWIVGETYFNDADEAGALRQAIRATHQKVLFLLQWPLSRGAACRDVSLTPPLDFDQYIAHGF